MGKQASGAALLSDLPEEICPMTMDCSAPGVAAQTNHGVRRRSGDPFEAARASLAVVAAKEEEVRAWAYVESVEHLEGCVSRVVDASRNAAGIDAVSSDSAFTGLLTGVPFGVKDVIDVSGMPTRYGSSAVDTSPARFDASCVALLRAAGAIPIGKTVTAEFAYVTPGPTRNPTKLEHTPGGSSSGSAAAVAAGMVPLALGTQTGGSIIRPAAFCGVVGFKPSFGAVARDGMKITCESLDVIGWYGANVEDVALAATVLLPQADPTLAPKRIADLRVAYLPGNPGYMLEASAQRVLDVAARTLTDHVDHLAKLPELTQAHRLLEAHSVIMHYELARSMLPIMTAQASMLSQRLRDAVGRGLAISGSLYLQMKRFQASQRTMWEAYFGDADLVLSSSALGPAPSGIDHTGASAFNKGWSLLGWPCLHLPTGHTADGLPLGVQLIARPDADFDLLAWARQLHPLIHS
jgi:Asp-tRNA(Asn)/Glu-tRNA(Gln) amidotransferase A subunit family amidase